MLFIGVGTPFVWVSRPCVARGTRVQKIAVRIALPEKGNGDVLQGMLTGRSLIYFGVNGTSEAVSSESSTTES